MEIAMTSEVNTLGHRLNRISEQDRYTKDFTLNSLVKALVEVSQFFPVYRTLYQRFLHQGSGSSHCGGGCCKGETNKSLL